MAMLVYHYAHGKFEEALGDMAASAKPFGKRLCDAYLAYLAVLGKSNFPPSLWSRFEALTLELTARDGEFDGEGSVQATTRHMDGRVAARLIREIGSISYSLSHHYHSIE